jgi:hypothetical protein
VAPRGVLILARTLAVAAAAFLLFLAFIMSAFRCFDSCPPESERLGEAMAMAGVLLPAAGAIASAVVARRAPRVAAALLVTGALVSLVPLYARQFTAPTYAAPIAMMVAGALLLIRR